MDIHERLKAIYDNCLAHMTDTPEDWERAFNALNGAVKNAGSKPEDVHEALKYYDLLEKQVGEKDMSDELREWYEETTYREINSIIRDRMSVMAREYVGIGFYLRRVRDNAMYLEDGYADIHEYAMAEFGMSKSTVNHCIRINEQFSVNGNAPMIDTRYKDFSKSQLQEMLYLPEDKREDVTPDMTVKQIRDMKDNRLDVEPQDEQIPGQMNVYDFQEIIPEEPVSILGYPLRVYPEGSIAVTPGCGKQDCFSCHRDGCGLRQEQCYCVEAPMGNPFPCTTLNVIESLRTDMGNSCQFVNEDLAHHRAGDGQPVPCCKKCANPCGYECSRSVHSRQVVLDKSMASNDSVSVSMDDVLDWPEEQPVIIKTDAEIEDDVRIGNVTFHGGTDMVVSVDCDEDADERFCETTEGSDLELAKEMLRKANLFLKDMLSCYSEHDIRVRKQWITVDALAGMISNLEEPILVQHEQPELPVLKNNDQRKAFIDNYAAWPIWIDTKETGERYYRYDFTDGSSFVIKVYYHRCFDWSATEKVWEERYSDGFGAEEYYLLEEGKYFKDCLVNRSTLVEFFEGDTEKMMKCKDCNHKRFVKVNGGPNRYYCDHPAAAFVRSECEPHPMICRTERHSEELTIKTSPKWCPMRKEKV